MSEQFEPLAIYRKGDRVIDDDRGLFDTEPGGIFEAIADFRAGLLGPRYVVVDRPGVFWRRITTAPMPSDKETTA